jgi:RHS repeat-associated protein
MSPETYDSNGNTLTTGGKTFAYDSENHLISMNGGAVKLIYDGDGNRVAKIVNGVTTQYLVDDVNPTGLPQVFEESINGVVQRTYTYGLQRISEAQSISGTWTQSFYGYDGGGSVRQLTNASAAITDTYNYDAFGNLLNSTRSTPNNYLYRGEQFDSDLGLYYLRARYYNPATGRFMSRDLLGGKTFAPKSLHKYLYASGDPVNRIDPRGRIDVVEYVGRLIMDLKPAMQFINTMGCVVGIGISAMSSELNKNAAIGILATAYGCVRLAPTGLATLSINPDIDLGICAFSVYAEATDINEYLNNPTSSNQTQIYADAFGGVLGCGITALGLALEE